jgi:hypothetical protein
MDGAYNDNAIIAKQCKGRVYAERGDVVRFRINMYFNFRDDEPHDCDIAFVNVH